jgi:hypothetical protein
VPQSSVMNSRRLMGLPKAKDDGLTIAGQGRASQQKRPTHVRDGSNSAGGDWSEPAVHVRTALKSGRNLKPMVPRTLPIGRIPRSAWGRSASAWDVIQRLKKLTLLSIV